MSISEQTIFAEPAADDWRRRLDLIVEAMQELSRHSDPQEMVRAYAEKVRQLVPSHQRLLDQPPDSTDSAVMAGAIFCPARVCPKPAAFPGRHW